MHKAGLGPLFFGFLTDLKCMQSYIYRGMQMSKIITTKIAAMTMAAVVLTVAMTTGLCAYMVHNKYDLDASVKASIVEFKVSGKKSNK
jgi:hypothetical protein